MKKAISVLTLSVIVMALGFSTSADDRYTWERGVDKAIEVYDKIPDAEYYVTVQGGRMSGRHTVPSCGEALSVKDDALANGASRVTIQSKYPTVNRSCDNRSYQ